MSVMADNLLTRADLDALPDDGLRHELIDGTLVMSPSPGRPHQAMVGDLYRGLWTASQGTDLLVLLSPFDVVLGPHVVEPDIVVAPEAAFTDRDLPTPPLLAVEVGSASTRWLDEGRKRTMYEEHGAVSYSLVDPAEPSVTVLELLDGKYEQIAHATGNQTIGITAPSPLTLNPADLAAG